MDPAADVSGKIILITGGASGIGAATASLLSMRGARVVVSDIDDAKGEALASSLSKEMHVVTYVHCDVVEANDVLALFALAVEKMGRIDVVVNNAGIDHQPSPMHEISEADFDRNLAVNLKGVWYCMREAVKCMASTGGGHIINVSSAAGLRSAPSIAAYSAAKHGVIGLTRSAAHEYTKFNIRLNAVCPSFIDTPLVQNVLAHMNEKQQKAIVNASPMRRLGKVEEVATLIAWLASDESSFVNGHAFSVDGGMLA
ncbi:MAG: SDR family NAD(P)-dependent oxidoreductase [Pseudomonadota bacterium]